MNLDWGNLDPDYRWHVVGLVRKAAPTTYALYEGYWNKPEIDAIVADFAYFCIGGGPL